MTIVTDKKNSVFIEKFKIASHRGLIFILLPLSIHYNVDLTIK